MGRSNMLRRVVAITSSNLPHTSARRFVPNSSFQAHCIASQRDIGILRAPVAQCVSRRHIAVYASDPAAWQSDPDVQEYGRLLSLKGEQPDAFVLAATFLRARKDLPLDLRASAGRSQASAMFRQALQLYQAISIDRDAPWPSTSHKKAVEAATYALDEYGRVVAESSDKDLLAAIAPYCADWPAAVAAAEAARIEVMKLRMEVRILEVRWLAQQSDRARVIVESAFKPGDEALSDRASRAAEGLQDAGLPMEVSEEDLRERAVQVAELVLEDFADPGSEGEWSTELRKLRSRGQVLLMGVSKDLAVACSFAHKMDDAAKHICRALEMEVNDKDVLTDDIIQQVRAAAQGVFDLNARELRSATTKDLTSAALARGTGVGMALSDFMERHSLRPE